MHADGGVPLINAPLLHSAVCHQQALAQEAHDCQCMACSDFSAHFWKGGCAARTGIYRTLLRGPYRNLLSRFRRRRRANLSAGPRPMQELAWLPLVDILEGRWG